MAYSNIKIDYEYIINLIQNIVTPENSDEDITPEERQKNIWNLAISIMSCSIHNFLFRSKPNQAEIINYFLDALDYAGHYANLIEELRPDKSDPEDDPNAPAVDYDYELMAYSNIKIDYEYIKPVLSHPSPPIKLLWFLLQNIASPHYLRLP